MVSRNLEKLSSAKQEILSLYPQSTIELIQSDFSASHKDPASFYGSLIEKVQKFEVSILINNVGFGKSSSLSNLAFEDIENMIGVNTYPSTFITHKLIPVMLNRYKETKKRSLVINFSSIVEETITPGSSVYAATKRYNAFFSEGLRYEYKDIDFSVIKPGPVMTHMLVSNEFTEIPLIVDPDNYAKAVVTGLRSGVNHAHWKHKLMGGLSSMPPYLITIGFIRLLMPWAVKKGIIR